MTTYVSASAPATAPAKRRVVGLDGIRGIAALFVVLHHTYLISYPTYPVNSGPWWLAWLMYGHLAVVVFIALSGFSLAIGPARRDWQLGGKARFAFRRAWRILPPYWAALVFSLIMAWTVAPEPGSAVPNGRAVAVYGLLLQDIIGSPVPNGAFWSIAVEAQLYIVFPLLLVMLRRASAIAMVTAVTILVSTVGVLAPHVSAVHLLIRLTPQFAALFALGLASAGILRAGQRVQRLPWQWFSLAALAPVLVALVVKGSVWFQNEQYWVDLALGPAIACFLAAVATGRARSVQWLLDTWPVRRLGSFSYSLYLIHAPIVVAISLKVVGPHVHGGLPRFFLTLALALPISLIAARWFAAVFEIPFIRYRSWAALREAVQARLHPATAAPPEPTGEPVAVTPTAVTATAVAPTAVTATAVPPTAVTPMAVAPTAITATALPAVEPER
jgi:peptidoglycan/LPS O-acetylase OafA/YrhL